MAGRDAVGKTVTLGETPRKATVVGVVADGKYEDLDEAPRAFLYSALSQHYQSAINIVARTGGDPQLWVAPMAQTLRGLDVVILNPFTFDSWMNLTLFFERMAAGCVAGLSALGLLLAAIGLFGAISYSVSERRKELGIRVALGGEAGATAAHDRAAHAAYCEHRGRGRALARRRRDGAAAVSVLPDRRGGMDGAGSGQCRDAGGGIDGRVFFGQAVARHQSDGGGAALLNLCNDQRSRIGWWRRRFRLRVR